LSLFIFLSKNTDIISRVALACNLKNTAMKKTALALLLISLMSACKNESKKADTVKGPDTLMSQTILQETDTASSRQPYGNNIESFIPGNYTIDMETEGDLNHDGLEDHVIILRNKTDSTAQRLSLVILQRPDKKYRLDKKSWYAVGPKYRDDGYPYYDTEDLSIDSTGTLQFSMYAPGPPGNRETNYRYNNDELELISISTYNMGAGGHTEINLNLQDGIYEQTDMNTMLEDMPGSTNTKKYKIPKVLFETGNPDFVISEAFNINGE
jgi:hypothetical protein